MTDLAALLAKLRELEGKATKGLWGRNPVSLRDQVRTGDLATIDESGSGFVADCRSNADCHFICAFRNVMGLLLDVVEAAYEFDAKHQTSFDGQHALRAALSRLAAAEVGP